jgi:hypothetical protein
MAIGTLPCFQIGQAISFVGWSYSFRSVFPRMAHSKALPAAAITPALLLFVMIFEADTTLQIIKVLTRAGPRILLSFSWMLISVEWVSEGIL